MKRKYDINPARDIFDQCVRYLAHKVGATEREIIGRLKASAEMDGPRDENGTRPYTKITLRDPKSGESNGFIIGNKLADVDRWIFEVVRE